MQEFIFCIVPLVFQISFNAELTLTMNILHSLLETYHILQIFCMYTYISFLQIFCTYIYIYVQHFCTYIYSTFLKTYHILQIFRTYTYSNFKNTRPFISVGLTFIFLTLLTFLCLSTYFILCLRNSRPSIFIANLSISSPVQIHWSCLSILQYSC